MDEFPIPLEKFNSDALNSVSDYNLRENISNIVDTLDTLGGSSLIKLRGSDSQDSKNEDPELEKLKSGDLENLICQGPLMQSISETWINCITLNTAVQARALTELVVDPVFCPVLMKKCGWATWATRNPDCCPNAPG